MLWIEIVDYSQVICYNALYNIVIGGVYMKKNILIIIIFVIFALPIPIAILGFFMSLLWFLTSIIKGSLFIEILSAFWGVIVGFTYLVTYIYSLRKTWKERRITLRTFLPIAHCLLALMFLLSLKPTSNYIEKTTEYFGFAKKDFSVVDELDTHGGFLGDGSYYFILDCSDNKEKALKIVEGWKKLPLSENLKLIMYGGEKDGISYNGYDLSEEAHMPKIKNGYYIFEDRHSESKDSADDTELFSRYSYNFSIAVYDCDTNKMYYFKYDT